VSDQRVPSVRSAGTVRWGILATGGIAHDFTADLLAHGHRVEAVGSRSLDSAQIFAQSAGIPRAHGSYEALVADPGVDVVYVATPHNFHAANAMLALDAGKHVLVEKAFTQSAAQALAIVELAEQRSLLVQEAMWTRFLPHMQYVRSVVGNGRLGQVRSVHAEHAQSLPADPEHRLNNPHLAGGALLDLGSYPISFIYDMLGQPIEVQARATFKQTGVDASVATIFTHDNGAVSTTYSSSETRGSNTASVLGTKGRLEIAATWYGPTTVSLYDSDDTLVEEFDGAVSGRGMQYQAAEVERLLGEGRTAGSTLAPRESLAIMTTMDEIREQIGLRYPDE
jgi:predicted dehydrogenase